MLADRTLLATTLLVTFASGSLVGYTAHTSRAPGAQQWRDPEVIYSRDLARLRDQGYGPAEMAEATQAYAEYFRGYESFWNAFLDTYRSNFDQIDAKLRRRIEKVDAEFRKRTDAK
jgi:hypothetical protein